MERWAVDLGNPQKKSAFALKLSSNLLKELENNEQATIQFTKENTAYLVVNGFSYHLNATNLNATENFYAMYENQEESVLCAVGKVSKKMTTIERTTDEYVREKCDNVIQPNRQNTHIIASKQKPGGRVFGNSSSSSSLKEGGGNRQPEKKKPTKFLVVGTDAENSQELEEMDLKGLGKRQPPFMRGMNRPIEKQIKMDSNNNSQDMSYNNSQDTTPIDFSSQFNTPIDFTTPVTPIYNNSQTNSQIANHSPQYSPVSPTYNNSQDIIVESQPTKEIAVTTTKKRSFEEDEVTVVSNEHAAKRIKPDILQKVEAILDKEERKTENPTLKTNKIKLRVHSENDMSILNTIENTMKTNQNQTNNNNNNQSKIVPTKIKLKIAPTYENDMKQIRQFNFSPVNTTELLKNYPWGEVTLDSFASFKIEYEKLNTTHVKIYNELQTFKKHVILLGDYLKSENSRGTTNLEKCEEIKRAIKVLYEQKKSTVTKLKSDYKAIRFSLLDLRELLAAFMADYLSK
jgi:hypothetical protein